jgi:hypothetical protein
MRWRTSWAGVAWTPRWAPSILWRRWVEEAARCWPTIRKHTDLHLFHHGDSLGSYQSTEQGDYKRLI